MEVDRSRAPSIESGRHTPAIDLSSSGNPTTDHELYDMAAKKTYRRPSADSDASIYVDFTNTGGTIIEEAPQEKKASTVYIDMTTMNTLNLTMALTFKTLDKGARGQEHSQGTGKGGMKRESLRGNAAPTKVEDDYDSVVAFGYLMCAGARSPFAVLMLNFVAPVILQQAQKAAEGNGGRLVGSFKASNIFSALYLIFAVVVILFGPPLGALADRTRHRKTLLWSLLLLCNVSCLLLLTAGSGPNSWMGLSALLVLTLAANELVGVPVLAYLPEVTTDPVKSMALSSASTIVFVVTCIVFAGVAIAIGSALQLGDAARVRGACVIAVLFSLPFTIMAIYKLPARGPAHLRRQSRAASGLSTTSSCVAGRSASPEAPGTEPAEVSCGSSMCVGFASLGRSALDLWATHPSLARFILARALYQAAQRSLAALATTYLVVQLGLSAAGVTVVMTLAFVCGIPGAALAGLLRNRLRGKAPLLIILLLMALSVGLCPVVLSGPENGRFAAPFAITWGIAIGFAGSYDQALFAGLVPSGKEAELSGLFVFSNSALEWLPPLLFSLCNQWVGSLRWALASLVGFYLAAIALLATVHTNRPMSQDEIDAVESRLRTLPLLLLTVQNPHGSTGSGRPSSASGSSVHSDSLTPDSSLSGLRLSTHGTLIRVDMDGQLVVDRVFPDVLSPIVESPAVMQGTPGANGKGQETPRVTAAGGKGDGKGE